MKAKNRMPAATFDAIEGTSRLFTALADLLVRKGIVSGAEIIAALSKEMTDLGDRLPDDLVRFALETARDEMRLAYEPGFQAELHMRRERGIMSCDPEKD